MLYGQPQEYLQYEPQKRQTCLDLEMHVCILVADIQQNAADH